jgi:hypothetical protein
VTELSGVLGLFGLTVAGMVMLLVGIVVLQVIAIYLGTTLAGLVASPGRALAAFFATVGIAAPGIVALAALDLPVNTHDALSTLLNLVAGTAAVRWLYRTDLPRALLGYGLAMVMTLAVMIVGVLVMF